MERLLSDWFRMYLESGDMYWIGAYRGGLDMLMILKAIEPKLYSDLNRCADAAVKLICGSGYNGFNW